MPFPWIKLLAAGPALLLAPAWAGPGHEHGETPTPTLAAAGLPRQVAASELFELAAEREGRRLTLYVDDAATNAPLAQAELRLTLDDQPLAVERLGPGLYRAELPAAASGAGHALAVDVREDDRVDMLGLTLDLRPAPPDPDHDDHAHADHGPAGPATSASGLLLPGLAVLGGLAALAWGMVRARRARKPGRAS